VSDPIMCEGVNLSAPDPVAEALAHENTDAVRSALGDLRLNTARAVRALVEATGEKVARQAYHAGYSACVAGIDVTTRIDADVYFILARVMGDQPSNASGGHEAEGREAPRG